MDCCTILQTCARIGRTGSLSLNTVSTVEAAANAIRDLILDGELAPGARLRENDFAERLGIARHSFRAATQILIGEGLLRREPNRGVQVPVSSPADIEDIFKLRAALEIEAVRLAIAAGAVPAEARRRSTPLRGSPPTRRGATSSSRTCASTGRSSTPPEPADAARLRRRAVGDRALHGPAAPPLRRPAEVAAEHEELLAAIEARDTDRADGALARPPRRGRREPDQRPDIRRGRATAEEEHCERAPDDHRASRPRGARMPRPADRPGRPRARRRQRRHRRRPLRSLDRRLRGGRAARRRRSLRRLRRPRRGRQRQRRDRRDAWSARS